MKAKLTLFSASLLSAMLLAGCQNTQVSTQSQIELPRQFSEANAAQGSANIVRWWQHWRDPVMNELIERGLQHNHDIRIAHARLLEARQNSQLARADLGPTVGASGSVGLVRGEMDNPLSAENRVAISQIPGAAGLAENPQQIKGNLLLGGFSASWEPDVFGAKRSDADAAYYAALGTNEKVYGTQMLVAGDIAENYINARAAQARLDTHIRTINTLSRLAKYVQGRFKAGHVTRYEVDEVQSKLTLALAQKSTIQSEYAAYVRNIAVLTAQIPQGFELPVGKANVLTQQPAAPSGQTPQGLLERRPDLRAYAAQVNAYAAKLASAKADLLPRFKIEFLGQGGRIAIDSDSSALKGWGSLLSLGIQVPIFTNGRIQANIGASDARLQAALLQYDQALLKALGEVDNAYQAQAALARQNTLLDTAHKQAVKQANDADKLFRYGDKTLDINLTARLNEEQVAQNLIQSRLARAKMTINLYKALGGGWSE